MDRLSVLDINVILTFKLHKVTSFFDVTAVKTNVTWQRRYMTSYTTYALNIWFLFGPGWDNMGEIRIVGPGKIRGYPYRVCKKAISQMKASKAGAHQA